MDKTITTIDELEAVIEELRAENAALKEELEATKKVSEDHKSYKELYSDLYNTADKEKDRLKGVLDAIGTLLAALK